MRRVNRSADWPRLLLGRLGQAVSIAAIVAQAAARYGLDPALVLALAQAESGLNPNAVSSTGAQGVMQLEPATAAQYGVTDPFDPTQNIDAGAHYLADLIDKYGDATAAVAAYNWGPGNVDNAMSLYGPSWLSAAPPETQNEVAEVLGPAAGQPPMPVVEAGFAPTSSFSAPQLALLAGAALVGAMVLDRLT